MVLALIHLCATRTSSSYGCNYKCYLEQSPPSCKFFRSGHNREGFGTSSRRCHMRQYSYHTCIFPATFQLRGHLGDRLLSHHLPWHRIRI